MSTVHIFVLIDAMGWELVEHRPFLAEFLAHQQPVRTMLGFSSGIIPSILTGRTPAETGMWNLVFYNPTASPFRRLRPIAPVLRAMDNRIGRRLLTEAGRRLLGMGANFDVSVPPQTLPWFDWAESGNIYARGGVPGQQSIFDLLAARQVPHKIYSYKDPLTDAEILSRAARDVEQGSEKFFFLYLCELDMFLHTHRDAPEKIAAKLAWYEQELGNVFAAARRRDAAADFHIFSDHGMTPVVRHCDLAAEVTACGFQQPADFLAVYDSTMARFWFFSAAAREKITARLASLDYARLLTDDELREFGVYFPDCRYGELVVLLSPGSIVAEGGFNGAGWRPKGMHGYHPDDPYAMAVYLSSHAPQHELASVKDIFTIMQEAAQ
ncbi:MAG: alkaline phosphatase family protein [Acidobacteriota bacterium]|nr:alkaline phosphatase family protein [Acidobacteriota bacterium]